MNKPLKILILSSRKAKHSSNLGTDMMTALQRSGHYVDFNFEGADEYIDKITKTLSRVDLLAYKAKTVIRKVSGKVPVTPQGYIFSNGFYFFMGDEREKAKSEDFVLKHVPTGYDIVIVLFMQDMYSVRILEKLYHKVKCPIFIVSPDMYPMTGGCYYFNDCRNFQNECFNCPAFGGQKDSIAHQNYLLKKRAYTTSDMHFVGNGWMGKFAESSMLFRKDKIHLASFVLDETVFYPKSIESCREELNIPKTKKVFLMRYSSLPRKGCNIAINAISALYNSLPQQERDNILLVTVGEKMSTKPEFDVLELGFVSPDKLISVYNAATAFLCPSVDDAGPSMVNHSIACGTPVVAFDSGTAQDVITNGTSGYKAIFGDEEDYGKGVSFIYNLSDDSYLKLRKSSRETALKWNSMKSFADVIERAYFENRNKTIL